MPHRLRLPLAPALLLAALTASLCRAPASEPAGTAASEAPAARTEYRGRQIARTMHYLGAEWLIRESREREEQSSLMLDRLGLKPGMTVCDMGCGNGYYSLVQ